MKNERIEEILKFIKTEKEVSVTQIVEYFQNKIPKITINRDLNSLLYQGKIEKIGNSVATRYRASFDLDVYFSVKSDERILKTETYNPDVWNVFKGAFTAQELFYIENLNNQYRQNRKNLSPALLKKELERLTIELSWKSCEIEGNTYTLLDTERLIKQQVEAEGKNHEEAVMILNHKKTLDFILETPDRFSELSIQKIEEIHRLLAVDLDIKPGIRKNRVGITGTRYKPLKLEFQIRQELFKLVNAVNSCVNPFEKAMLAVLMISYIQPFEDGNKRTARILGDAVLLAFDYCPLSYRSVSSIEYKKAVILFYEQNNYKYFKQLFIGQFKHAIENYF
jgi:Fic family protein